MAGALWGGGERRPAVAAKRAGRRAHVWGGSMQQRRSTVRWVAAGVGTMALMETRHRESTGRAIIPKSSRIAGESRNSTVSLR